MKWQIKAFETNNLPQIKEYPSLILRLLALRGITEPNQIQEFLNPEFTKLHDPNLFQQMPQAVERIKRAIEEKEKITIYADYDADAITAASVVYLGLKKLGLTAECYIPDRFAEGYGMNVDSIKAIAENGTKLIITVDCGINAVEEAALCKTLGVDLIITDHHEVTGVLPEALAIINPKNPTDTYPFPYLTGVGVAYKLISALFGSDEWHRWLLDLVAIGTVADLQSLTGENRILVGYGLKVLPKTKWPGLKALLETAALKDTKYDTFTLGFILAPRINAAGRIKHGQIAFELLTCEDPVQAKNLAEELNALNVHRQFLTKQIVSEAKAQIEASSDKKVLLAVGNDWPKGIVGLVAGKLLEEYNRPVLAVSTIDGMSTGSARSTSTFDMVAALTNSADLLEKYGGHKQAAGFTLVSGNLDDFYQRLLAYAETTNLNLEEAVLEVDSEIEAGEISWEFFELLSAFEPFGFGNSKPRFLGRNLEVVDYKGVGATNQHLKLKLKFGDQTLGSIAFNKGFLMSQLNLSKKLDAVFELSVNEWNGNKNLELKIVDLKLHD